MADIESIIKTPYQNKSTKQVLLTVPKKFSFTKNKEENIINDIYIANLITSKSGHFSAYQLLETAKDLVDRLGETHNEYDYGGEKYPEVEKIFQAITKLQNKIDDEHDIIIDPGDYDINIKNIEDAKVTINFDTFSEIFDIPKEKLIKIHKEGIKCEECGKHLDNITEAIEHNCKGDD